MKVKFYLEISHLHLGLDNPHHQADQDLSYVEKKYHSLYHYHSNYIIILILFANILNISYRRAYVHKRTHLRAYSYIHNTYTANTNMMEKN